MFTTLIPGIYLSRCLFNPALFRFILMCFPGSKNWRYLWTQIPLAVNVYFRSYRFIVIFKFHIVLELRNCTVILTEVTLHNPVLTHGRPNTIFDFLRETGRSFTYYVYGKGETY